MAFTSVQSTAYFIDYGRPGALDRSYLVDIEGDLAAGKPYGHVFCGAHEIGGAECPNCRKPLLRFLQLDTADPRLGLGEEGTPPHLPLLYCWRCPASEGVFSYRIEADGGVELLACRSGKPEPDWPYANFPGFFPEAPARLVRISDEAQQIIAAVNRGEYKRRWFRECLELMEPRHQYGGEPRLVQFDDEASVECPACRRAIPLLATIGDDCLDPRGFVGEETVQVVYHYCQPCRVVACFNACD